MFQVVGTQIQKVRSHGKEEHNQRGNTHLATTTDTAESNASISLDLMKPVFGTASKPPFGVVFHFPFSRRPLN